MNAKLSRFVRLVIYSYLPFNTLLYTVAVLSNHERKALENSSIVRINKEFKVTLTGKNWLEGGKPRQKILTGILTYIVKILTALQVKVIIDKNLYKEKQDVVYEKLADLIVSLPHWFDHAQFSLVNMKSIKNEVFEVFCKTLSDLRPNFVFKSIEI